MKILVVDDEFAILELIKYNLQKEGFSVLTATHGTKALSIARAENPNLVVLDLMLPDMSGLDVCRILRNDTLTSNIPIIMATAKTEDIDIISGLDIGADDYITKPFSPKVLVARVKSLLRRTQENRETNLQEKPACVDIHGLQIMPEKFEVTYEKKPVIFSATEFAILLHLAKHPGKVFQRQQIINDIKGESYPATERSIDVQILSIRKKLVEASGNPAIQGIIETVRGVGYRFLEEKEVSCE